MNRVCVCITAIICGLKCHRYTAAAIKRNFCGVIRRRIYKYDEPRPHKFVADPCRTDTF